MSDRYATKQSYGGQRASVCRAVGVKYDGDISAGEIVAITHGDLPVIRAKSEFANGLDSAFNHSHEELPFAEVRTEADVEAAPARCWFWPPRV